ncbi:hypothetical protein [Yoonia sp.]|uniref:hypothetical protein n=1 Tax=Yoonia sp. TaxID=2212373 RepID=UPI0035C7D400
MPLRTLLLILIAVIGLAAATVAGVVLLTGGFANASVAILAGISAVTLLASILIRRFGANDSP